MLQVFRAALKQRIGLEHDPILVQLREHRGNLALAERVVQCVVEHLRRDAQAGGRRAIDDDARLQALVQLIAGDVAQHRQRLQPLRESAAPRSQAPPRLPF